MKEEWRDIPRYEGLYQVSTYGRIKSYDKYIKNGKNSERFLKGRVLSPGMDKDGYLHVILYKNSEKRDSKIHRLIAQTFILNPESKKEVNHKDGDKSNNHIENLEWCTAKENCTHKIEVLNRTAYGVCYGEKNGRAKLTGKQAKEIKCLLKEGKLTQKQIAERYNVAQTIISHIKLGKIWKHIK